MRIIPIAGTVGSSFHHYFEYYRRNLLDKHFNEALIERRYKMDVSTSRSDTTTPDFLRQVQESKQAERKQETRNLMNKERENTNESNNNIVQSTIGTIIDVYA